jgi:hypothetical protein
VGLYWSWDVEGLGLYWNWDVERVGLYWSWDMERAGLYCNMGLNLTALATDVREVQLMYHVPLMLIAKRI